MPAAWRWPALGDRTAARTDGSSGKQAPKSLLVQVLVSARPDRQKTHENMVFGEIVSPVGPTSSFVAAVQRRGSCQTHHRACSKSSSWKSACRSDQNSSPPVPLNPPARPFERPLSGTPHVAQTKTRLRQSHSTPLPGRSRDQLAEHRMPGGQPELVPDGPAAHALPSARETACRTTAGAIRGVSETSGPEVSPS